MERKKKTRKIKMEGDECSSMNEKTTNTIALHQMAINELKEIKHKVQKTATDDVRFRIETKHWYGYSEPFLAKSKDKLEISTYTMLLILDEAINKEKQRIDKLIDQEIDHKLKSEVSTNEKARGEKRKAKPRKTRSRK